MAEEQNQTVDAAPAAAAVVLEVKEDAAAPQMTTEESTAAEAAASAAEDKPAEDAKPAETTEEAEGAKEEEVKVIEEGHLGYKAQGAGFPKNLISTKTFFSFGTESMSPEALAHYRRLEKHADHARHNICWAAHSAKGLLFVGDKKAPTGIINLSDASEPELDGAKGFHLTARGNKHTFKAVSADERDSWVAVITTKIAEAKEIAASIAETDLYKQTMETFKPAPPATPAKEDKPEEAGEGAPKPEEGASPEEAPKEEGAAEGEETKADDAKDKRRSNSRKRVSIFGFGKKEDKEEAKPEEHTLSEAPAVETVPEAEAPATEETPAVEEAAAAAAAEDKPVEEATSPESPNQKPNKRSSFFGVFSKKEKKVVEVAKTEEAPKEEAETTDSAPVIPPVETSDPLAVDVSSPEAAPAETVESPVAAGESSKDTREKRKSSMPFNFGKREKSPGPGSEDSKGAFFKLRATIRGSKSATKSEEKPAGEAVKEEGAPKEGEPEAAKEEQEEAAETAAAEEAPKADEEESSKEGASAPAVTAAA